MSLIRFAGFASFIGFLLLVLSVVMGAVSWPSALVVFFAIYVVFRDVVGFSCQSSTEG